MDFPSFSQLFETARNEALLRSPPLSQDAIDRPGSDANILIAAACAAADEVIGQLITTTSGLFLDSATGEALDRLLFDRYGLTRKVAANAVGSVTFQTTAPAAGSFLIPSGTQLTTAAGTGFETVGDYTFQAGSTGPLYVTVRSLLAGADQQAKIGTITSIAGTIANAPGDLTVTNPVATSGAADAEADADFRARGREFYTTVQRGTLSAIVQGALTVPGVDRASAYEQLDSEGRPYREVSLIIADKYTDTLANYNVTPGPTYDAQSRVLAQTVFNALDNYRPAGTYVRVQQAQVLLQPVSLALSFVAGVNIDRVATTARAAVVGYINSLNPGDDIIISDIVQLLSGISGLVVTENDKLNPSYIVTSPPGDVLTLSPIQVQRTSLALVRASSSNPGLPLSTYYNPDSV